VWQHSEATEERRCPGSRRDRGASQQVVRCAYLPIQVSRISGHSNSSFTKDLFSPPIQELLSLTSPVLVLRERLNLPRPTPHPASRSSLNALTRADVTFGSLPQEITLIDSIHAFSFAVSWSHCPAGAVGGVNTVSDSSKLISPKSPAVRCVTAPSDAGRCCRTHHAAQ